MLENPKRYTITAALPYTNGPIHIGHLAGVYVPSDIYARYLRLQGKDVAFICGSDEHGVAISMKAKKEGITPQQVIDKYDGIIRKSFKISEFRLIIIHELLLKFITIRLLNFSETL
jgi:methionyl-tRNA synthetase